MKIGVISYLLRHHGTAEAMDFLREIGFEYTGLDFRHADGLTDFHQVDARGAARARKLCVAHGITPLAYCVGGLSKERDADYLENVFEFARGLEVPVITGVLDPDLLPEMDELCERIYHVHFKDSDQHLPLGGGTVDLPGIYQELERQGFDRLLSIEHYEYRGISDEDLRKGLAHGLGYVRGLAGAGATHSKQVHRT